MGPKLKWTLAVGAAIAVAMGLLRLVLELPGYAITLSDPASGDWGVLAHDVAHGHLYRPLFDPAIGYGGTRYFPLHFVLHGGLMRLGLGPLLAGHLIDVGALIAVVAATYAILRRLDVDRAMSVIGAGIVCATPGIQEVLTQVRGDILASALSAWGLYLGLAHEGRRGRLLAAGALFGLAFATKMTTVFGAVAVGGAFLLAREPRRFALVVAGAVASTVIVLGAAMALSQGRFPGIMFETMALGVSDGSLLRAPARMAVAMFTTGLDWILLPVALYGLFRLTPEERRSPLALAFVATLLITIVIFSSIGISVNHFVDLDVILVVFLVVLASRQRVPRKVIGGVLVVYTLYFAGEAFMFAGPRPSQRAATEEVLRATTPRPGDGPLLAENPWVPILHGETPFVIDAFMLRQITHGRPDLQRDFDDRLRRHFFRAVVLSFPLDEKSWDDGSQFYGDERFVAGFKQTLLDNYELAAQFGKTPYDDAATFYVWRPKAAPP